MSESSNGFMAYTGTGVGAVRKWAEKRRSWDAAMLRRAEAAPAGVEFVPFSLEASGVLVWGPASRRFFAKCLYLADDDRDIGVYPTYYLPKTWCKTAPDTGSQPQV
jgi:hypothetical protein